jgi:hypothetical protein
MRELEAQIRDSLVQLFPALDDLPGDWQAIEWEAQQTSQGHWGYGGPHRRRVLVSVAAVIVAVGCVGAALAYHFLSDTSLTPANISALTDPTTALPAGTPVYAGAPGELPSPGAAHTVGNGAAVAWMHGHELCWSTVLTPEDHGVSSCGELRPNIPIPFTPIVHTDGDLQSGPVHVFGLTVDAVNSVVVTLEDGSTYSAVPTENWFDVALPAGDFSSVATVTATLDDGSVYPVPIHG